MPFITFNRILPNTDMQTHINSFCMVCLCCINCLPKIYIISTVCSLVFVFSIVQRLICIHSIYPLISVTICSTLLPQVTKQSWRTCHANVSIVCTTWGSLHWHHFHPLCVDTVVLYLQWFIVLSLCVCVLFCRVKTCRWIKVQMLSLFLWMPDRRWESCEWLDTSIRFILALK